MASTLLDMRFDDFGPSNLNRGGIIEIWTGGAMQAELARLASQLGAQANSMAHLHGPHGDLYESGVDVLSVTAVGYVSTSGYLGCIEQSRHHTLDSLNH